MILLCTRSRTLAAWALPALAGALFAAMVATAPAARAQSVEEDLEKLRERMIKEIDARLEAMRKEMIAEVDRTIERMRKAGGKIEPMIPREWRPAAEPAYLGVKAENVDAAIAELMDLPDRSGVYLTEVVAGSPAAAAGLKPVDVILEFDGAKLKDLDHLKKQLATKKAGDAVSLLVLGEDGRRRTVKVTLGTRAGGPAVSLPKAPASADELQKLLEEAFARGADKDAAVEDMFDGFDPEQMRRMQDAMRKMLDGEEFEIGDLMDELLADNPELKKQIEGLFGKDANLDELIKQFLPEDAEGREKAIRDAIDMLGETDSDLSKLLEEALGALRPDSKKPEEGKAEPGNPGGVSDLVEDMLGPDGKPKAREKGFLGVRPAAAPSDKGVAIEIVFPDGAAAAAGMKAGDVITSIGGVAVKDMDSLAAALGKHFAGDTVAIEVLRDGKTVKLSAKLAPRPAPINVAPPVVVEPKPVQPAPPVVSGKPTLGLAAADSAAGGIEIRTVAAGGPAEKAGLKPGDRLVEIDGMEISDRDSLRLVMEALKSGQTVPVKVLRDGKEIDVTLTVGTR